MVQDHILYGGAATNAIINVAANGTITLGFKAKPTVLYLGKKLQSGQEKIRIET